MDKTTVSASIIVGGFFTLLVVFFAISFLIPSLNPDSASRSIDQNHQHILYDSSEQPKEASKSKENIDSKNSKSNSEKSQEVRVCSIKIQTVRNAPGSDSPVSSSIKLSKGQEIYVMEERNGWLKIRTTPDDRGKYGWIKKDQTEPKKIIRPPKHDGEIVKWMRSGLLVQVDPKSNTATVNTQLWTSLDDETKTVVAKALSTYFSLQKETDEIRCIIHDADSGKTIASYSDKTGLHKSSR